ncbi:AAA family ATPase [Candidatus Pacearchaeota archaeon]|nr:AAA family ATPase [Candidatus Pacearchaeota archaeon]
MENNKTYYIIIRGSLGAGKTTIAKKLAKQLNAEYVFFEIKLSKEVLKKLDEEGKNIPVEYFIKEFVTLIPKIKYILNNNKISIIDGAFYYKELLEFIFNNLKYKKFVFDLKTSLDVCINRDKNRDLSYGKDAAEVVYNITSSFDYGIPIDVTKPINESIKEIVSYLPK